MTPVGVEESRLDVGELRLRTLSAGSGETVVLLHGFPQCADAWTRQLGFLAGHGYRAVAPDLRGYGGSDRPRGVAAYAMPRLVGDVVGLCQALGGDPVTLVGHDWGGAIGWACAARHPGLLRRLVIVNAPHPARYARLLREPGQRRRSWYALFFQLPFLPEVALRRRDFAAIRSALRRGPRTPDTFSPDEVERCLDALRPPGALTAVLNYYRALGRSMLRRRGRRSGAHGRIEVPTLLVWGDRDAHLVPENADGLERWVEQLTVRRFPGATHWLPAEESDALNSLLLDFLREGH